MSVGKRFLNLLISIGMFVAVLLLLGLVNSIAKSADFSMLMLPAALTVAFEVLLDLISIKGGILGRICSSIALAVTAIIILVTALGFGISEDPFDFPSVLWGSVAFSSALHYVAWSLTNYGVLSAKLRPFLGAICAGGVGIIFSLLSLFVPYGAGFAASLILMGACVIAFFVMTFSIGYPFSDEDDCYGLRHSHGSYRKPSYASAKPSTSSNSTPPKTPEPPPPPPKTEEEKLEERKKKLVDRLQLRLDVLSFECRQGSKYVDVSYKPQFVVEFNESGFTVERICPKYITYEYKYSNFEIPSDSQHAKRDAEVYSRIVVNSLPSVQKARAEIFSILDVYKDLAPFDWIGTLSGK